jgi:hypothetical protein
MIGSPAFVLAFAAVASCTFALAHLLAQQVFDLRIDAAQLVGRPSLDIVVEERFRAWPGGSAISAGC